MKYVIRLALISVGVLFILVILFMSKSNFATFYEETESTWPIHENIEEVGWSKQKLNQAKAYFESINSTAAIAIYDGKVLFQWGDVAKNTNAHSVRKSLLSSLYGIYEEKNVIRLDETIGELEINDLQPLNEIEQQATVEDLLTSRSGVFFQSGEESWRMRRTRPLRGNFAPGTFFYYNNWDFNVLGTIFNKKTEKDLFQVFNETIAKPIEMEDFSIEQTYYKYEPRRSIHPSYLFQMSARDMARFGQLILQNGRWGDKQIIPEQWVVESTSIQANVPGNEVYDYGYMWWVAKTDPFASLGLISAVGRHGQSIDIVKEENLVLVHRVDSNKKRFLPFAQKNVKQQERLKLLSLVLAAKEN